MRPSALHTRQADEPANVADHIAFGNGYSNLPGLKVRRIALSGGRA
jgi:hypothetical protein